MPTTWGWTATLGCMVAMSWLFAYAYSISFIGGEVKRPDKTIIWANVFAIAVPFVFMLWIAIVLNKTVGYQFLNASAWNDQNGPISGFNMPFGTNFIDLAVYTIGTSRLVHEARRRLHGPLLRGLHALVDRPLVPGLPAHPVRLGHGPHGPQVVHGHQPPVGEPGEELHRLLRGSARAC